MVGGGVMNMARGLKRKENRRGKARKGKKVKG